MNELTSYLVAHLVLVIPERQRTLSISRVLGKPSKRSAQAHKGFLIVEKLKTRVVGHAVVFFL
jgi:hypothetical protein